MRGRPATSKIDKTRGATDVVKGREALVASPLHTTPHEFQSFWRLLVHCELPRAQSTEAPWICPPQLTARLLDVRSASRPLTISRRQTQLDEPSVLVSLAEQYRRPQTSTPQSFQTSFSASFTGYTHGHTPSLLTFCIISQATCGLRQPVPIGFRSSSQLFHVTVRAPAQLVCDFTHCSVTPALSLVKRVGLKDEKTAQ